MQHVLLGQGGIVDVDTVARLRCLIATRYWRGGSAADLVIDQRVYGLTGRGIELVVGAAKRLVQLSGVLAGRFFSGHPWFFFNRRNSTDNHSG